MRALALNKTSIIATLVQNKSLCTACTALIILLYRFACPNFSPNVMAMRFSDIPELL